MIDGFRSIENVNKEWIAFNEPIQLFRISWIASLIFNELYGINI